MLKHWQSKYPKNFDDFPNIHLELEIEDQTYLSKLLFFLERSGAGLLNDIVLKHILYHSLHTSDYLYTIQESLEILSHSISLSLEPFTFLVATQNHRVCVQFILKALKNDLEMPQALDFLTHQNLDGLSQAMAIFEQSDLGFYQKHLNKLKVLSKVLSNPLCQTIFDARLRGFSDYIMISDPLKNLNTTEIINQISQSSNEDTQIQIFFDYFAQFRPLPLSQKYMIFVDVAERVAREVELSRSRDFDTIKYRVASNIERDDLYSTRTYQDHMAQIGFELNQLVYVSNYQSIFRNAQAEPSFASPSSFLGK